MKSVFILISLLLVVNANATEADEVTGPLPPHLQKTFDDLASTKTSYQDRVFSMGMKLESKKSGMELVLIKLVQGQTVLAWEALKQLGRFEGVTHVIDFLGQRSIKEEDNNLRIAAVTSFRKVSGVKGCEVLGYVLENLQPREGAFDADLVRETVTGLKNCESGAATQILTQFLVRLQTDTWDINQSAMVIEALKGRDTSEVKDILKKYSSWLKSRLDFYAREPYLRQLVEDQLKSMSS